MEKVIIATKNKGKLAELEEPLNAFGFCVETLPSGYPEIEENGESFEENALIKARYVCKDLKCIAIADDSGLCVDYLQGEPGIFSARYANDYPLLEGELKCTGAEMEKSVKMGRSHRAKALQAVIEAFGNLK